MQELPPDDLPVSTDEEDSGGASCPAPWLSRWLEGSSVLAWLCLVVLGCAW
jgi:hypothetical protein